MEYVDPRDWVGERAWANRVVTVLDGVKVAVIWTDQPYRWHANDGEEVFVVLDGEVDMHVRVDGEERVQRMVPGTLFHFREGDEHVARPRGAARVLVVERAATRD